ncbi:uncharacterized protein LOC105296283 [Pteropus vampyrus]|uniref:Uncharacterized protein LOC105296283 n=1 Tax=Pteropus vampyrus TaxID=132908 RepID=A0A6P6CRM8_PTEVA|nr:uncharacterized protein LOC105296283 [Pteropus vampyrus]
MAPSVTQPPPPSLAAGHTHTRSSGKDPGGCGTSSGALSCMAIKRWSLGLNLDRSDSKACQLFCYTISLTGMKSSHGELIWNTRQGKEVRPNSRKVLQQDGFGKGPILFEAPSDT